MFNLTHHESVNSGTKLLILVLTLVSCMTMCKLLKYIGLYISVVGAVVCHRASSNHLFPSCQKCLVLSWAPLWELPSSEQGSWLDGEREL